MNLKPFVKWAGGKRQLLDRLLELLPSQYNHYYEPFVGGGALFFHLKPPNAFLNDVNTDLLSIYKTLHDPTQFAKMILQLDEHEKNHSEDYYYVIREMDRMTGYNELDDSIKAARLIYLNKSCFNGLYRVNSKGYFNVPFGKKDKVNTYDIDNLKGINEYFLKNKIEITNLDFEDAVKNANTGDFIYFDPPYDPIDKKDSFTAYSKNDFNTNDQIRLANLYKKLDNKGVYLMLSNHNTKLINELYKGFKISVVEATRMINSKSSGRGSVEEVIITNY